jgi:hypothetical protein
MILRFGLELSNLPSLVGLFIWNLHRELPFPHSLVEHVACQPLLQTLPTPSSLAGVTKPAFSSSLVYLQFTRKPAPPSLELKALHHLFYMSFSIFCLLFSCFSLILWGRGQSFQGALLVYPRSGCGDIVCCLFAHLLVCISQAD